jgi:hypothetical protein
VFVLLGDLLAAMSSLCLYDSNQTAQLCLNVIGAGRVPRANSTFGTVSGSVLLCVRHSLHGQLIWAHGCVHDDAHPPGCRMHCLPFHTSCMRLRRLTQPLLLLSCWLGSAGGQVAHTHRHHHA